MIGLRWMVMIAVFLLAVPAFAADFAVQIGSYRTPDWSALERARDVGEISSETTASGLTRVKVGRYASRAAANDALARLQAAGFHDAFLTMASSGDSTAPVSAAPPSSEIAARTPAPRSSAGASALDRTRAQLTPEQRSRLVLLDGRPHLKEGDRFIPVSEVIGR